MIYYICIINNNQTLGTATIAEFAKTALINHSQFGNHPTSIMNEGCMFIAINTKEGVKKIDFKEGDRVRLSIAAHNRSYYAAYNIDEFLHIKAIFDELKAKNVLVDPNVAYA